MKNAAAAGQPDLVQGVFAKAPRKVNPKILPRVLGVHFVNRKVLRPYIKAVTFFYGLPVKRSLAVEDKMQGIILKNMRPAFLFTAAGFAPDFLNINALVGKPRVVNHVLFTNQNITALNIHIIPYC